MGYDASGNLTSSNGQTMTYDAEGMLTSYADTHGNSGSYKYTAYNDRMRKDANGSWTEYIEFNGDILAEKNADGSWTDYIYADGKRIAKATGSTPTGTQYYHADHLGTARLMTDSTGAVLSNCTYTLFGAEQPSSPSNPANHYKFTGKERDTESGMDYFGARYYANNMGRWASPDWSEAPDAVPYADFENPQTLNLYGYLENNPLSATDPDGHARWAPCQNDSSSQCWTGDKNGEVDEANGTVWNSKTQQWEQPTPPPSSYLQHFLDWRQNFINNWNQRIGAHGPPSQKPSSLDELQYINNIMMGMVPYKAPLARGLDGKVHDVPDHVPDGWTHEDLELAKGELQESIKTRNAEQGRLGEDGPHRDQIRKEEYLLRQIDKKLSGSQKLMKSEKLNYDKQHADILMEKLAADPCYSRSGRVANDLLTEFHRGYPLINLLLFLQSHDSELVKIGTWIASELGEKGKSLFDDVSPLLQYPESKVRFLAIDCILLWADPSKGNDLVAVVNLIRDPTPRVRWKVMDFLSRATTEQLSAALSFVEARNPQSENIPGLRFLVGAGADSSTKAMAALQGHDRLMRKYGVVLARRIAKLDKEPLLYAASMNDADVKEFADSSISLL